MRTNKIHNLRMTFRGGPLDGQSRIKTEPGRWPSYLADDGESVVRTQEGDRWLRTGKRSCYVHTESPDVSTMPVTINHVYVHSSIHGQR